MSKHVKCNFNVAVLKDCIDLMQFSGTKNDWENDQNVHLKKTKREQQNKYPPRRTRCV